MLSATRKYPPKAALAVLCLAVCASIGCSSGAGARSAGPAGSKSSPAAAPQGAERPIIIATDRGLEEIDAAGSILRRLSPTPARRPRFLPDGSVLFVAVGFAELRRVGVDGKGERPAGVISPQVAAQCDASFPRPWDPARLLFADADMVVDRSGDAVCMHLSDGREADSRASVWLRVSLSKSGGVELVCGAAPPEDDFWCHPAARESSAPTGAYDLRDGHLVEGGAAAEKGQDFGVELTLDASSSSGRYALVSASVKRGGERARRVLVLDRESGDFFAIAQGSWPKPMGQSDWKALAKGKDTTVRAAVQSDVRALDRGDLLVVDSLLITPGKRVIDTKAQLAR